MVITTIKLVNNSNKVYNGVKPGQSVNVENPEFYLVNGFTVIGEEDQTPVDPSDETTNYAKMKLADLKQLCEDAGIEVPENAKKSDLIELLGKTETPQENQAPVDPSDEDLLNELD